MQPIATIFNTNIYLIISFDQLHLYFRRICKTGPGALSFFFFNFSVKNKEPVFKHIVMSW